MFKMKSSTRGFGIVFFIIFLVIGLYPLLNDKLIIVWSLILSLVFLTLGLMNSAVLVPLNFVWYKFGLFLGKFVSPIVINLIYILIVFPTSIFLRIFKKNYLHIKYEEDKKTYWLNIDNEDSSIKDQF